jgi:hypothetical protein
MASGTVARAADCPPPTALHDTAIDRAFVQERFLAGVERPLRSQGRLLADAEATVWHMTAPFDVKTTIDAGGITQSVDGGPPAPMGAGAAQIGAQVARTTAAMLQGRWTELEKLFTVVTQHDDPGATWTVSLTPLDPRLASILSAIEVEGCTDVSTIVVSHPGGDREVIRFVPDGAAK